MENTKCNAKCAVNFHGKCKYQGVQLLCIMHAHIKCATAFYVICKHKCVSSLNGVAKYKGTLLICMININAKCANDLHGAKQTSVCTFTKGLPLFLITIRY